MLQVFWSWHNETAQGQRTIADPRVSPLWHNPDALFCENLGSVKSTSEQLSVGGETYCCFARDQSIEQFCH